MSVLYLALPIALLVALAAVVAFIWSVRDGQLDDLETPAIRMLQDEKPSRTAKQQGKPDTPDRTSPRSL